MRNAIGRLPAGVWFGCVGLVSFLSVKLMVEFEDWLVCGAPLVEELDLKRLVTIAFRKAFLSPSTVVSFCFIFAAASDGCLLESESYAGLLLRSNTR